MPPSMLCQRRKIFQSSHHSGHCLQYLGTDGTDQFTGWTVDGFDGYLPTGGGACLSESAGLLDMILPINGRMMAVIAAAGIGYNDWMGYIWKSWLLLLGIGLISSLLALLWFA